MDRKKLGLTTLCFFLVAGIVQAQIPENVMFQPASYGGGGAPGRMPVYWQPAYIPQPVTSSYQLSSDRQAPRLAKAERTAKVEEKAQDETKEENGENGKNGKNDDSGENTKFSPIESDPPTFGEQWQEKFPATPDLPTVPVLGTPMPMEVVAPIPYLAYHTTLDGRTHVVPYGPAYLYAPEQLPRRTTYWKRFWSSHPSHKQDDKQVWYLSYYDPTPTILESEPDWWKRTLGYPRPIWGPEPAASWIGGLPAATLSKVTMHFYEGSYQDDWAQYEEDRAQYETEREFWESQSAANRRAQDGEYRGQGCPLHGVNCPHHAQGHRHGHAHPSHHATMGASHGHGPHGHGMYRAPHMAPRPNGGQAGATVPRGGMIQKPRQDRTSRVSIEGGRMEKGSTGTLILETEDIDKAETDPFSE